jgi:DNA-binding IclR family transcriptional regulator
MLFKECVTILSQFRFDQHPRAFIRRNALGNKPIARCPAQQGYAMDDQETDLGARCVAAPVLDQSGKVAAAISVSGPITRLSRDRIQAFALATKRAARAISARLGHSN